MTATGFKMVLILAGVAATPTSSVKVDQALAPEPAPLEGVMLAHQSLYARLIQASDVAAIACDGLDDTAIADSSEQSQR